MVIFKMRQSTMWQSKRAKITVYKTYEKYTYQMFFFTAS